MPRLLTLKMQHTRTHPPRPHGHTYTCIFRKAHGEPCSCCPPTYTHTHCTTFTAFCHSSNTDRQEANVSFIRACFQSVLMMNISDLPHAAPEYSETKASYEIILSLEWLLWLDSGTGLAICLALRQRNDMIKTNYHVFLHENTLKGLVSKYDTLYSFWVAKKCPCVVEFFNTLLFGTIGRCDVDKKCNNFTVILFK